MSVQDILIDGQGTFNDVTENAGVVSTAVFAGSATNSGSITQDATFSDSAANHGTVAAAATFTGGSVNTGTVAIAVFQDGAVNAGTVSVSAAFAGTAVNTGTVQAAIFTGSAANQGGTVVGDAIFADTTSNTGTVQGNAQVASTATNNGTVQGSVSEYVPPSDNPAAGTVLYSNVPYDLYIIEAQHTVTGGGGTYDTFADGSGGSYNDNYQFTSVGTEIYDDGSVYHYVADGNGSYTQYYRYGYTMQSGLTNYIDINGNQIANGIYDIFADGNGGNYNGTPYSYPSAGTELYDDGSVYHYVADGNGSYNQAYRSGYVISSGNANTIYISEIDQTVSNGTYNSVANGDSTAHDEYSYPSAGTELANDGTYSYQADGNGGYTVV